MNVNKKLLTGLIGIAVVTIFAGMAAGEFRGAKKAEGPRIAAVTAVQKTFRLQGKFERELSGPYDLLFKIYSNESQEELIAETTFPQVAFEGGFYTIDVNPSSLGLKQGKDYWLTIDIPETEIPTQEAKLEIVAKNTIQLNADGEDRGTITGGQDYVGNFSDYMVKITNKGTGYTIWAVSEKGTAVYAQASAPGKYAVHAENPQGTALFVNGKAKVQGDLEVTGQTNLSNVILPANSVGSAEIKDNSIVNVDIASNANIAASKIADGVDSGLDADLLDGKDSSEFLAANPSGDLTLGGNLTVNGTGNSSIAGNVGIGTTNPTSKLTISGGDLFIDNAENSTIKSQGHNLYFGASGYAHRFYNFLPGAGVDSNTRAQISIYEGDTSLNYQEKIRLSSSDSSFFMGGNVGIGTTAPGAKLDVGGTNGVAFRVYGPDGVSIPMISADIGGDLALRPHSGSGKNLKIKSWTTDGVSQDNMVITSEFLNPNINDVVLQPNGGNVGIGTASPNSKLEVAGYSDTNPILAVGDAQYGLSSFNSNFYFHNKVTGGGYIFLDGNVGMGTRNPSGAGLGIGAGNLNGRILAIESGDSNALYLNNTTTGNKFGIFGENDARGNFSSVGTVSNNAFSIKTNNQERITVTPGGRVGIGTTNPGAELDVNGTISGDNVTANYQDLAEWAPSTQELTPGTVVAIDPANNNHVVASTEAYDSKVAGVVSKQPGFILGQGGEGRYMIAHTGRVKVKVDARYGAIAIGDLLVASPVEGTAMKSQPKLIDGEEFHRPGTILGKALEPLQEGQGEILVLLSLQ